MPDHHNNTDPIEHFFREKAGEYDITFREEDWNRLEQELDRQDARRKSAIRWRWAAAAVFLIFMLMGYFTWENHQRLNEMSRQIAGGSEPSSVPVIPVVPPSPDLPGSDPDGTDTSAPLTHIPDPDEPQDTAVSELTSADIPEHPPLSAYDREPAPELSYADAGRIQPVYLSAFSTDDDPVVNQMPNRIRTAEASDPLAFFDDSEKPEVRSFSVGLAASPDLSMAGNMTGLHQPGYKIGITLEYRISDRFSVSAGVLPSVVRYSAPGRAYNPNGYWAGGSTPDEITGECLLFDIPVSLRLDVMNFSRSRLFATAGISSYIMQNEEYRFRYREGTYGEEGWSGQTGTRHWMSNAGFSVGYEYDLHPNWGLRAEPFMKIPVREVGWGNVKLYSVGTFISLNYRL
jgi:hypothetical protein